MHVASSDAYEHSEVSQLAPVPCALIRAHAATILAGPLIATGARIIRSADVHATPRSISPEALRAVARAWARGLIVVVTAFVGLAAPARVVPCALIVIISAHVLIVSTTPGARINRGADLIATP